MCAVAAAGSSKGRGRRRRRHSDTGGLSGVLDFVCVYPLTFIAKVSLETDGRWTFGCQLLLSSLGVVC